MESARSARSGDPHARALGDARRNPHLDIALPVFVLNAELLHASMHCVFQIELDFVLDVASRLRARPSAAADSSESRSS